MTESTLITLPSSSNVQTNPPAPTASTDREAATSTSTGPLPQATSNSNRPGLSTSDQVTIGCALGIGIPTLLVTIYMCWKQRDIPVRLEHAFREWWNDFWVS